MGSAGSRSAEQAATAKKRIEDYLVQNIDSTIAYTDGSALKNPGPCGAGAAIFKTGHSMHPTELERPVSKKSHSYHGELQALDLCLDNMVKCPPNHLTSRLIILSDCQSALITAASFKLSKEFTKLQIRIQQATENLLNKGHNVLLKWVPGHTDVTGNDLADRLAKNAAAKASNGDIRSTLSLTEAKNSLKAKAIIRWKNKIKDTLSNHQLLPQPSKKSFKSKMAITSETRFHRLVLNHTWTPQA